MIKGVNRNVIEVKADKKSRFERVYFVMKKNTLADRSDMLKEANSIIGTSGNANPFSSKGAYVLLGLLVGSLLSSAVWLIVLCAAF